MRVSLRHVAERAGVSRVTASNVLNGRSDQVSPDTRHRVARAMRDLNYVPVAPPALQSRHVATRIIGLVFDYIDMEDPWGLRIYQGLRRGAQQNGYDLLSILRTLPDDLIDSDLRFLDRRSDGFIFILPRERTAVLQTLVEHRIPVVACDTRDVPHGVPTIAIDDADAMRQSVNHLIANGHRRILHLAGPQERDDFRLRREGYEAAMRDAGLQARVVAAPPLQRANQADQNARAGVARAYDAAMRAEVLALIEEEKITAVASASDNAAMNLWRCAEEDGLRVPRRLSITGMDDYPGAAEAGLTTIRFDSAAVGQAAIETLIQSIEGGKTKNHVVPVHLVARDSVAPPSL